MGKFRKVKIQDVDKNGTWVSCAECDQETLHKIWSNIQLSDRSEDGYIQTHDDYMIIQCNGCKTVSFCSESTCSEDFEPEPNAKGGMEYIITRKLYPSRISGRPKMKNVISLPLEIRLVYEETHGALCIDHRILTGIGLRAIIESVCKDQQAKGVNLKTKINDLVKKGFITTKSAKILQDLRFMGNKSAHEVRAHSTIILKIAFDIIEHLLIEIYILPKIAENLPKNKQP